jgi:hypothetical protein
VLVSVCQNISEILTRAVSRNVLSTTIVLKTNPAFGTNVQIRALGSVDIKLIVS